MSVAGDLRSHAMRRVGSTAARPGGEQWPPIDGRGRTVLVVGDSGELAVAVRDRLDRAYVTVWEVHSAEVPTALQACAPWPWVVVGDDPYLAAPTLAALAAAPSLVLWRGESPTGLPAHARCFARFSELADALESALGADVEGIRLAPGDGLTMPDGRHCADRPLEALVTSHPRPLFAAWRHFRSVDGALEAHGVSLRLASAPAGGVRLAAAAG